MAFKIEGDKLQVGKNFIACKHSEEIFVVDDVEGRDTYIDSKSIIVFSVAEVQEEKKNGIIVPSREIIKPTVQ